MMSPEYIRELSDEAAELAAQEGMTPYVPWDMDEVDTYPPFPFPFIGDYVPDGWEETEECWFVDTSGWGSDYEPALSVNQLKAKLKEEGPGYGYALTEMGQFQGYLQQYRRVITFEAR